MKRGLVAGLLVVGLAGLATAQQAQSNTRSTPMQQPAPVELPIPALGTIGMVVLGGLLLGGGTAMVRRKSRQAG